MKTFIPHSKPTITPEDIQAVAHVLKTGHLAQGQVIARFEDQVARVTGTSAAAAVHSGTSALHLALLALGIKKRDEVILPTYACTALLNAVNYTGASPVLVDVGRDDFNISVEDVKRKVSPKTRAIIAVHMFGMPADLGPLLKLGIPVIEDCAQSFGARIGLKPVGSLGLMSICSFYATKVLTTGEGGMVVSSNKRLIEKVKDLRAYDTIRKYTLRYNYKMTDFQAALGLSQLAHLPSMLAQREKTAIMYHEGLDPARCQLPLEFKGRQPIYYRYVLQTPKPSHVYVERLGRKGICAASPVDKPLHHYVKHPGNFIDADWLTKYSLSIPIYPSLTKKDTSYIIACVNEAIRGE